MLGMICRELTVVCGGCCGGGEKGERKGGWHLLPFLFGT